MTIGPIVHTKHHICKALALALRILGSPDVAHVHINTSTGPIHAASTYEYYIHKTLRIPFTPAHAAICNALWAIEEQEWDMLWFFTWIPYDDTKALQYLMAVPRPTDKSCDVQFRKTMLDYANTIEDICRDC